MVICIIFDYCASDGNGRIEWSIFNSWCSLYFYHCILFSFSWKTQKGDCPVKVFVAKLDFNCVLFLYTCNVTLCQWSISHSSQSQSGFSSCKFSISSDTHHMCVSDVTHSNSSHIPPQISNSSNTPPQKIPVDFHKLVYKTTHYQRIAHGLICWVPRCLRRVKLCFCYGSSRDLHLSVSMVQWL